MKPQVPDYFIILTSAIVTPFNLMNTHLSVRKDSKLSSESKFESGPLSL